MNFDLSPMDARSGTGPVAVGLRAARPRGDRHTAETEAAFPQHGNTAGPVPTPVSMPTAEQMVQLRFAAMIAAVGRLMGKQ